ncbi:MAG: M43 family zinc metalloprotease [Flavobacterium sp.]|nr:M43 family zinc metalloprotease [Flavobacterium sp.]
MSSISNGQKLIPLSEDSGKTKTGIKSDICGTDFFHNQKMKTDAGYRKRYQKSVEAIKKTNFKNFKMATQGIRQVPVVVHVMHKGESVGTGTNISDEDVKRGIQYLNNYWRKAIGTPGFGDGADMKIEFALAVQDPNGNCTNGINRVNMSGVPAYVNNGVNVSNTNGLPDYSASGGVNSLKEYGRWDSTKYYNIYLVDEIDNGNCTANMSTSGYAHNAAQHGQPYDGTVILICEYVQETSGVLAHELGHALNLPHTFNGDDANGDGVGDRCGDDNIPDTPRHIRTSSLAVNRDCNSTLANNCDPLFNQIIDPDTGFRRNSGTVQDHMHNYMDYTGCRKEFTGGQRTVATNALTANRASYLTSSALTPKAAATVYFTSSTSNVCIGEPITFYDASSCTPNTYTNTGYNNISFLWTFNNNVNPVITSTLQNPTFTFTNLGTYDVTLTVTNSYGTTSLQKVGMIAVTPGIVAACSMTSVYKGVDGGTGVTNVLFNTLSNRTGTFITDPPLNNFSCSKNTTISVGTAYGLNVTYQSASYAPQFLEVWIDWDNSGTFETLNSNGVNERVLSDNIAAGITKTASASITPPATAALNTLLRMRVISDIYGPPIVCGDGLAQRADDYAVYVNCNPTTPNAISGTVTQCPSVINQVYSVAAVANATSYNWTVPQGWRHQCNGSKHFWNFSCAHFGCNGSQCIHRRSYQHHRRNHCFWRYSNNNHWKCHSS